MKKITFLLTYSIAVLVISTNPVNAQKNGMAFTTLSHSLLSPFERMGFTETRVNNFNIKAVRDFVKTYKTIDNNKWFLAEDGSSTSTFNSNGITTVVVYNNKGKHEHTIRVYEENKLPFDIRHIVKREYYDATITLVKEVETNKGLVFFVHMQDAETWKIVRIADGEMQLEQTLTKT